MVSASMVDRVVGSQYQLLEELGRGAYGCLFLAQSIVDNNYVAIKILSKKGLDQSQLLLQKLEMEIQSSLCHENILKLFRVIQEDDEHTFLIMELCDQGDLFDFSANEQDEDLIKPLFMQILDAMDYMHAKGVYHRDIKLENILLASDDIDDVVTCKVADFGLATQDRYSFEYGCGSTGYLAPEHFVSNPDVPYDTAASDIWSLGILLLGLLFGTVPWQDASDTDPGFIEFKKNPRVLLTLFPDLSLDCFQFLLRLLELDPSKRTLSFDQLKDEWDTLDHLYSIPAAGHSYDSGIFSHHGGDDDDKLSFFGQEDDDFYHLKKSDCYDEDMDIFIHGQEKESWWL
jgi:serine/threonine protein kinase